MTNEQTQTAGAAEILPGASPQGGPVGASAYFDRAGVLWIAACLALAVGAGYWIPGVDKLRQQTTVQPDRERLSSVAGQPSGAATPAARQQKVW